MLHVNRTQPLQVGLPEPFTGGPPQVTAMPAGYYLVQFSPQVCPRNHIVTKDRRCACAQGADCPAIQAVHDYLKRGGVRAPAPRPGSIIPPCCPFCQGAVRFEPRLCSRVRGAGWICLTAAEVEVIRWSPRHWCPGESHYWQYMWAELGRLRCGSLGQ
jgi:hypothetical protein